MTMFAFRLWGLLNGLGKFSQGPWPRFNFQPRFVFSCSFFNGFQLKEALALSRPESIRISLPGGRQEREKPQGSSRTKSRAWLGLVWFGSGFEALVVAHFEPRNPSRVPKGEGDGTPVGQSASMLSLRMCVAWPLPMAG